MAKMLLKQTIQNATLETKALNSHHFLEAGAAVTSFVHT